MKINFRRDATLTRMQPHRFCGPLHALTIAVGVAFAVADIAHGGVRMALYMGFLLALSYVLIMAFYGRKAHTRSGNSVVPPTHVRRGWARAAVAADAVVVLIAALNVWFFLRQGDYLEAPTGVRGDFIALGCGLAAACADLALHRAASRPRAAVPALKS